MNTTIQRFNPRRVTLWAGLVVFVALIFAGSEAQSQPLNDVSLEASEKCGWGPFGERTFLVNDGQRTVEATVEKRMLAAPRDAQPETQRYVVSPGESKFIGCTRTKAKRGPVFKYSVIGANYLD